MSNMSHVNVINKSTHRITANDRNYIITVGHFSKGGYDELAVRRHYDWRGVHLIWYGEIRNVNTNKWGHVSAESKQRVIEKLTDYVKSKENLTSKRMI